MYEALHIIPAGLYSFHSPAFSPLFTIAQAACGSKARWSARPWSTRASWLSAQSWPAGWEPQAPPLLLYPSASARQRPSQIPCPFRGFFIFLVANIGGSSRHWAIRRFFLGFLKGVSFFWTTVHLFVKTVCMSLALLGPSSSLLTSSFTTGKAARNRHTIPARPKKKASASKAQSICFCSSALSGPCCSRGMVNFRHLADNLRRAGRRPESVPRSVPACAGRPSSWKFTSRKSREKNGFSWAPIEEVAAFSSASS